MDATTQSVAAAGPWVSAFLARRTHAWSGHRISAIRSATGAPVTKQEVSGTAHRTGPSFVGPTAKSGLKPDRSEASSRKRWR